MFLPLVYFYALSALFIIFDLNIIFVNEEFLIFICMAILFSLMVYATRKFVHFFLFLRAESIYFFFVYLISLNVFLIDKLDTINPLNDLKLQVVYILEIVNFFVEAIFNLANSERASHNFLIRNLIFLTQSNIYAMHLFKIAKKFTINNIIANTSIFQSINLSDFNLYFNIVTKKAIKSKVISQATNTILVKNSMINSATYFDLSTNFLHEVSFLDSLVLN